MEIRFNPWFVIPTRKSKLQIKKIKFQKRGRKRGEFSAACLIDIEIMYTQPLTFLKNVFYFPAKPRDKNTLTISKVIYFFFC